MLSVPVRPSPATMTRIPSTLGANKSMKSKWCLNAMAVTPEQGRVRSKINGHFEPKKLPHNTWTILFFPGLEPPTKTAATNGSKFPEILITMKLRYFVGSFCQGGYPSGGIGVGSPENFVWKLPISGFLRQLHLLGNLDAKFNTWSRVQ